jgi:hypothetical protein
MNASILKGHRRGASLVLNNPAKDTVSRGPAGPFHLHKSPSSNDDFRLPVINSVYGTQNCVSLFSAHHNDAINSMVFSYNIIMCPISTILPLVPLECTVESYYYSGGNKLIDSAMPNQILNTAHGHAQ